MPLLKHGRPAEDVWVAVGDDEALPGDAPAILSLERWQRDREALRGHNGPLGIRLNSDQSPTLVADDLSRFSIVVLDFPIFRDGRPFSYARLLRDRYGFEGEVRAVGTITIIQQITGIGWPTAGEKLFDQFFNQAMQ